MIDGSLLPAMQDVLMVFRSGSVGGAARRLHKTPSAVSQQIRRIEASFGIRLFERAGRGVRLTAAGDAAVLAINRLYDEAEAVFGTLFELSGNVSTLLRVAASDYLGKALLLPVIRELMQHRDPVRFEITTMHSLDAPRSVERGEVDFEVVTSRESREGLKERTLLVQPFVWIGPKIRGARVPLHERLAREPLLRLAAGSQGRRLLDAFIERERIRPFSTIDVPSVSLMLSYVSGGLGIGLAPKLALAGAERGRVTTEPAAVEALPVKLVYRANFRLTASAERFVERLAAEGHRQSQRLASG
jgi:DNA-binding transcriptional LysR family regulator